MLSGLPRNIFPLLSTNKLARIIGIPKKDLLLLAANVGKYYNPFDKYQKEGNKWRHIDNPVSTLHYVQRKINKLLLRPVTLTLPDGMVGGIVGKSSTTNALAHIRKEVVVRLDLKDCFPNISNTQIYRIWKQQLGCGRSNANLLTKFTSFQTRLPQGAPTSPALCNIAILPLFKDIEDYLLAKGLSVTMYIDDITFSGSSDAVLTAIGPIIRIIQKKGFSIRNRKINIMPSNKKQISVGLLLNTRIGIERDKVEKVRKLIIELSKRESISKQQLDSVKSKIRYIKSFSRHHGEKLEKFTVMLLPQSVYIATRKGKVKTRKCYCTRWHEK